MNDRLEIPQEIYRRMNESGQTNYLHSLFLNLSVQKIVQRMNKLGDTNNNFSVLFPLKTKPKCDQDEIKRWHIANNIVFLFLKKHRMNLSIKTALLEFSPEYINNKEEKDLKAIMHCPKSENLIISLIKFNFFQNNNNNSNSYSSNNTSNKIKRSNNTIHKRKGSYDSNKNKKNTFNINRNIDDSNSSSIDNNNNNNANNSYTNINTNNELVSIRINRSKKKKNNSFCGASRSVCKSQKNKLIEKLEQGTRSPKSNRVTIKWDMAKSNSSNPTTYTYNTYGSESENYQYYDSICYESEETLKNEMKILSNSKGTVRKVDLLKKSIFNFGYSKLEELLEIKRKNLSSKMFSYQISVTIIQAKDLTIIDFLSSLDPFCTIQYDTSDIFKTKVVEDSKTPVWNNSFGFITDSLNEDSSLLFEIYDSDPLGIDKKLSTLQIYLFDVMDNLTIDKWFEMKPDTIYKLQPQLHLKINVDLIEKEKQSYQNNQIDLESPDSYNDDLTSTDNEDHQSVENKLHF